MLTIAPTDQVTFEDAASSVAASALGARIRTARKGQRLSIRELSARVGVSASFVSQVELGRATPSIGVLYSIASLLELSLDSLMNPGSSGSEGQAHAPSSDSRALLVDALAAKGGLPNFQSSSDRSRVNAGAVVWERLTSTDVENIEFLQITYPPGSESCQPDDLQRHSGWEFGHVLSGAITVQVGFASGVLQSGDSIHFSSTIPHRLSNPSDDVCVALWIVVGRTHSTTGVADLF
jgi:transcriptional regulator with XRE-family HTH domain